MTPDDRRLSFGSVAERYDQFRSDTPPEAAAIIGDLSGLEVLDVGAGTGKLTRFLLKLGGNVTVVEPDDDMRRVLIRRSPDARALAGSAEALPVDDASYDVVLSSSAWHWFKQPDATKEMARVLRDNGRLIVMWNGFSKDVEWTDALTSLRNRPEDGNTRPRGWNATFDPDGAFEDVRDFHVDWKWSRTVDEVVVRLSRVKKTNS